MFSVTLMPWICILFYIFPLNFMSIVYFPFDLAQAATGYMAWVFEKQEAFHIDPGVYPNIGTDPSRLVQNITRKDYVIK